MCERNIIRERTYGSRSILKVKKGTTIDLIYHELNCCSVIAKINDRQFNFFQKLYRLTTDNAIVKVVIEKFNGHSSRLQYYENLRGNNGDREIEERKQRILTSTSSLCQYYCELYLHERCMIYYTILLHSATILSLLILICSTATGLFEF